MTELEPERVAIKFVNEINRHDVEALSALMAPDFRFFDTLGQESRGRDRAREAWTAFFARLPDYRIVIRDHLAQGSVVALFGGVSATIPGGSRWTAPVAWRAVIRDHLVAEWQLYSEFEPARRALAQGQPPPAVARDSGRG